MSNHFWDNLLDYVLAGRVVPIIGPELLLTQVNGRDVLLHRYLAERIAADFEVAPVDQLPEEDPLNFVVCRFLDDRRRRREDIYPLIQRIMKSAPLTVPEPLRKLARITKFKLLVTTNFDSFLEKALEIERPQEAAQMKVLSYSPNRVEDLPAELSSASALAVYHLFGRVSSSPDFVITEEDTLEFFYAMQAESKRPELLFDALKESHLLIIGSSFPDWLARFFIRIAKGGRLSMQREPLEIVADQRMHADQNLVLFLEHFSYRTEIFKGGGAIDFVNELSQRYEKLEPTTAPTTVAPAASAATVTNNNTPASTIFLSYAIENQEAASKIRDALVEIGWDVWFDKKKLVGGDDFGREFEQNIRRCSLFLPIISAETRARDEGWFRVEWRTAVERAKRFDDSVRFIVPLVIDDTPPSPAAKVPSRFLDLQWMRLIGGQPTPEFANTMKALLREQQKRQKGLA